MPLYYLNVEYVSSVNHDQEGEEFESSAAALAEARIVARELLVESIRCSSALVPRRILVCDAGHREVGTVHVKDVVPQAIY